MAEANMHLKKGNELIEAQKRLGTYEEKKPEEIKPEKKKR